MFDVNIHHGYCLYYILDTISCELLGGLVVRTTDSHPGGQGSNLCIDNQNFVIFAPFFKL